VVSATRAADHLLPHSGLRRRAASQTRASSQYLTRTSQAFKRYLMPRTRTARPYGCGPSKSSWCPASCKARVTMKDRITRRCTQRAPTAAGLPRFLNHWPSTRPQCGLAPAVGLNVKEVSISAPPRPGLSLALTHERAAVRCGCTCRVLRPCEGTRALNRCKSEGGHVRRGSGG